MNYDLLEPSYYQKQIDRLSKCLAQINGQKSTPPSGRVIPESSEIAFGTGRRLQMAILFLDICGFSKRAAEKPEEQGQLLNVMNFLFTEVVRIAEDYGGTVEKHTGDGVMVYFENKSLPPVSGAKRAISATLTIFSAVTNLINPVLIQTGIEPIQFRAGIDFGFVTIAKLGAQMRFGSLVAVGTTANRACKMLNHAAPNKVVIGANLYNQLPASWKQSYCRAITENTGWIYSQSGAPYPFYEYFGRWKNPQT